LKEKAEKIPELSEYEKVYAIFSKSNFSDRLKNLASQNSDVILIDKDSVLIIC
jgi:hypothetical protein